MQLIILNFTTPFGTVQRLVESVGQLPAVHILRLSRCWSHVDLVSAVRLKVGVLNVEVRDLERELGSDRTKDSQRLKAAGGRVRVIRNVLLHVASCNETSFAGNLVVYGLIEKQPSLGWRHLVDEDLLAESVNLEKSRQLLFFSLSPKVCVGSSHGLSVTARLLQLSGEQSDEE